MSNCYQCGEACNAAIQLPMGDMERGIWFEELGKRLVFENEEFCSLKCFVGFVVRWYEYQLRVAQAF